MAHMINSNGYHYPLVIKHGMHFLSQLLLSQGPPRLFGQMDGYSHDHCETTRTHQSEYGWFMTLLY